MQSIIRTDIKLLTAIDIAGSTKAEPVYAFFNLEAKETVQLCLEGLMRRKLIKAENGELSTTEEGHSLSNLHVLFGASNLPSGLEYPKPAGPDFSAAALNLLINGSIPVHESNIHNALKTGRLESVFPHFANGEIQSLLPVFRHLALSFGAVTVMDDRYVVNPEKAAGLVSLSPMELALAIVRSMDGQDMAKSVEYFLSLLTACPINYSEYGRIFEFILLKNGFSTLDSEKYRDIPALLQCLHLVHVYNGVCCFNPLVREPAGAGSIACDTDMTVKVYGTIRADCPLWIFADILTQDNVSVWVLNRAGFFRALDAGIDPKSINETLGLAYYEQVFQQWEKSYRRIGLYQGTVVSCTEDIAGIIEALESLRSHVICRIAPCVYLMKTSTSGQWRRILAQAAGLDALPQTVTEKPEAPVSETTSFSAGIAMPPAKEENREKLVSSPEELYRIFDIGSTFTADGMDYTAKETLVRQAFKSGDSLIYARGTENSCCGKPVELIKTKDSGMLVKLRLLPSNMEQVFRISSFYSITAITLDSSLL